MHRSRRWERLSAVAVGIALLAAACGDDDDSSTATTTAGGGATTTAAASGATTTAAGGASTTAGSGSGGGSFCGETVDDTLDADQGAGAGYMQFMLACAKNGKALEAEGEPIVVALQNAQGDPVGSFPGYTGGVQAAVEFINKELGGVGADLANGTPGRPLQVETCFMTINPADSVRCANELAAKEPLWVLQGINFFTQQAYPVLQAAGTVNVNGTPINAIDFTGDGVYSIGAGGGCVGIHPGMVEYTVNTLLKDNTAPKIMVPWSDTPPALVCYHDTQKKPLDIIKGVTQSPSEAFNTRPELTHGQVPVTPAAPDLTPQATTILDFDPDAILFSAQSSDCWNLVDALSRLGWTAEQVPLVMGYGCLDIPKMQEMGEKAKGSIFVTSGLVLSRPDLYEGLDQLEAQTYLDVLEEYGADLEVTGDSGQGFQSTMLLYDLMNEAALNGTELTSESFATVLGETQDRHFFGSTPLACADAADPYTAICNTLVTAIQWDGEKFEVVQDKFDGTYIIAGSELDTGS